MPPNQYIKLRVRGMVDGLDFVFRINRSSKMRELMTAYFGWQSVLPHACSIVYLYDGLRLKGDETPIELELKDGDIIDAMPPQPLFSRMEEAYRVQEKLMKELEYVNAFISSSEAYKKYFAELQNQSSEGSR